jgi:hypothetical protein
MGAAKATQAFLKEYRDICIHNGMQIEVIGYDGEIGVVELPPDSVALVVRGSRLDFLTIDDLLSVPLDNPLLFLPTVDELETAIREKEIGFRDQLQEHLKKRVGKDQ